MAASSAGKVGRLREMVYVSAVEKPERLAILFAVVLAAASCGPKETPTKAVLLAASSADLMPEASPGTTASLRLGTPLKGSPGAEFEVALRHGRSGSTVGIELLTGGETLEREAYRAEAEAFRVEMAGDDAFKPPIDLLRYPARSGDAWKWKGKVVYAGASREAHAAIRVAKDGEEVRSDVVLFVAADAGRPDLERRLTFWFRKGKGVSRRSFGGVSARFPRGEPWRP